VFRKGRTSLYNYQLDTCCKTGNTCKPGNRNILSSHKEVSTYNNDCCISLNVCGCVYIHIMYLEDRLKQKQTVYIVNNKLMKGFELKYIFDRDFR